MDSVTLYGPEGTSRTAKVTLNADAQTASFDFGERMPKGAYLLDIVYTGKIGTQANGLFALDYQDPDGTERRGLFTQFEAPDARRFVPSWITRLCSICPPPFRRTRWRSATCR